MLREKKKNSHFRRGRGKVKPVKDFLLHNTICDSLLFGVEDGGGKKKEKSLRCAGKDVGRRETHRRCKIGNHLAQ